jgi:hypothetical protein
MPIGIYRFFLSKTLKIPQNTEGPFQKFPSKINIRFNTKTLKIRLSEVKSRTLARGD